MMSEICLHTPLPGVVVVFLQTRLVLYLFGVVLAVFALVMAII